MKNSVLNTSTADLLMAKNGRTQLEIVGCGKLAYLWIGAERAFYGHIDNSAALRKFLRSALKRLEAK